MLNFVNILLLQGALVCNVMKLCLLLLLFVVSVVFDWSCASAGKDVRYLNDTHAFDVEEKRWMPLGPAVGEMNTGSLPPKRSACQVSMSQM